MSGQDEWTVIEKKKKKPKVRIPELTTIQKNRPTDSIIIDVEKVDFDDEYDENKELENPMFWNNYASIGNIRHSVNQLLMKYNIFPKNDIMRLFACLKQIDRNISIRDLKQNFDQTLDALNKKIVFLSALPRFTPREYGHGNPIYLIHIRFDWYLISDTKGNLYEEKFLTDFEEYFGFLGRTHTHVPVSDGNKYETENRENFLNVMKILKDKKEYDKFQPDYEPNDDNWICEEKNTNSSKNKPYYPPFSEENKESNNTFYKCRLHLEDAHSGFGEIMDDSNKGKKIYLHNRRNCFKAFNQDIVKIMIFKTVQKKKDIIDPDDYLSGRVISVVSSDVQPVNKIFLCHILYGTSNLMVPICKTIPVIYVDNNFAKEQVIKYHDNLHEMKNVENMNNAIQSRVKVEFAQTFANKSLVTIKKLNRDLSTTINKMYFVDCYHCDFVFLVLYRKWDDKHRFPFGEVVGLYTPDFKFGNILNLIKVTCDVPVIGLDEEEILQQEISKIKTKIMKESINRTNNLGKDEDINVAELNNFKKENEPHDLKRICFAFKYPHKEFHEIAFSYIRKNENEAKIGIHVAMVSKVVTENGILDNCARNRFFTFLLPDVSPEEVITHPDYLLSKAITTELLSIRKDKECNVISFYFSVNNQNEIILENDHFEVERITLDKEIDANSTDEIIKNDLPDYLYLIKIFQLCQSHRGKRQYNIIPTYCFYPNFLLKTNLSTVIIEEELKYITNRFASVKIKKSRIIDPNLLKKICDQVATTCNIKLSPVLCKIVRQFLKRFIHKKCPHKFSQQFLMKVMENPEINLFKCEALFPDSGFFHKKWKLLAEYDILDFYEDNESKLLSVTNPLSCYLDLVLQRFLISNEKINDLDGYYVQFKHFQRHFQNYWAICNGYEIRHKFNRESFILDCIYENRSDDRVYFHHPFLDEVNYENFIYFQSLNLNNVPVDRNEDSISYLDLTWKAKIFLNNNESENENFINPVFTLNDIYCFTSNNLRDTIHNANLRDSDIEEIQTMLNEDLYTNRLTSEISENIDPTITLNYSLTPRQIMRIQFGYDYSEGIMKIVPELWIINPDFRLCLSHRNDPLKYFMHPQELSNINYKRFQDFSEYKSQFTILNRLEGIHQTINTESSFFIHDLKIDWLAVKLNEENQSSLDEDNIGIILLEETWTRERFLRFVHKKTQILDPVKALNEARKNNKMDFLLCIQTFIKEKNVYWIGHSRVSDICLIHKNDNLKSENKKRKKNNLIIHITFKLVHSSFPLIHSENRLYSVEFMETPITCRIFERSLRKLQKNSFHENIVLGNISKIHLDQFSESDSEEMDDRHKFCDSENILKQLSGDISNEYLLNEQQRNALTASIDHEFTLIWGPPGTGKTLVGCMIAYCYSKMNKITTKPSIVLYCGPSNQSVNVVAEKLIKTFGEKCPNLLRVFNKDIVNFDFPYPGASCRSETEGCPEKLRKIALHHIVRRPGKPYERFLNRFSEMFGKFEKRSQMNRLDFALELRKYELCLKKAFESEIEGGNYEIILTTAAGSCKNLFDSKKIIFSQVLLDECGMCSEPEALGPIINKRQLEHIVLIGDHRQLKPIVTCQVAKGKQLNVSLFERLYRPGKPYCIMLDTQYRMHPSICEFPSIQFYGERKSSRIRGGINLRTARCENWTGIPDRKASQNFNGLQYVGLYRNFEEDLKRNIVNIADDIWKKGGKRRKNFKCYSVDINFSGPSVYEKILFINNVGIEINQEVACSTGSTKSKGNESEAAVVGYLYKKLIEKTNSVQSILVITQYRLQEFILKDKCERILCEQRRPGSPRISTVVRSQGSESDYVIFSTVRSLPNLGDIDPNPTPGWISKYLGFITDENQFNVALTRAKKGLFIIGNSHLLSVDETWKNLITDLKNRHCFLNGILAIY